MKGCEKCDVILLLALQVLLNVLIKNQREGDNIIFFSFQIWLRS